MRYINGFLAAVLAVLLFYRLPGNEEFLKLMHIPSGRVTLLENVKKQVEGKTVLTPIQTFFLFQHTRMIPLESLGYRRMEKDPDYVVLNVLARKEKYEKLLRVKLQYQQGFQYNGSPYNLFKVER